MAVVFAAFIQLARSLIGHAIDVNLPPPDSYRNNFLERGADVILAIILAGVLVFLLKQKLSTILGLNKIAWNIHLLWLLPFVAYLASLLFFYDLVPLTFNASGLLIAASYCFMGCFVVETHSRGIIVSILYPLNIWTVTLITGILLPIQGFAADWIQFGAPKLTAGFFFGIAGGFAYAFAMAALRLRLQSLIPVIIVSLPLYFISAYYRPLYPYTPLDIVFTSFFFMYGLAINLSMRNIIKREKSRVASDSRVEANDIAHDETAFYRAFGLNDPQIAEVMDQARQLPSLPPGGAVADQQFDED